MEITVSTIGTNEFSAIGRDIHPFPFIYKTDAMVKIMKTVEDVAGTDLGVLILGETGVGKKVIARALHNRSERSSKQFFKVNCAALPKQLLESELFGYERGAFTGAYRGKPGRFDLAHGGTLLLDEIAEMSPTTQAKLLHVIQDGQFSRLGGRECLRVNVRIIAATNRDLKKHVRTGRFREDLYYRLNIVEIYVPPLREQREEILPLLQHFLKTYGETYGRAVPGLSPATMELFGKYPWPGNIRELEDVAKRLIILGDEDHVKNEVAQALSKLVRPQEQEKTELLTQSSQPPSLNEIRSDAVLQAEQEPILDALMKTRWNRKKAALLLGISYKSLLFKIKKYRLHLD
jgi:two-component system response regulator AtoC